MCTCARRNEHTVAKDGYEVWLFIWCARETGLPQAVAVLAMTLYTFRPIEGASS